MSRRCLPVVAGLLLILQTRLALAESLSPGKYSCHGQVVQRSDGQIAVFWGSGCYNFPRRLHGILKEHLGKFVNVDSFRISDEQAGIISPAGSVINSIERITVLANGYDQLPVRVDVTPAAESFSLIDPVRVRVAITNQSGQQQTLHLYASQASLCQDYSSKQALEGDNHYYDDPPYGNAQFRRIHNLQPGKAIHFDIQSSRMAESGEYQLVYLLSLGPQEKRVQSNIADVTVKSASPDERRQALKHWLPRAAPGQRVEIASQLAVDGDASATREVLALLRPRDHSKPPFLSANAYGYAWKHGGKEGETVILNLIRAQRSQDRVLRMVEQVYMSPDREAVLLKLLSSKRETYRDISGWVDRPRVCDIAGSWLAGYTQDQIKFPNGGSEEQRDKIVGQVRQQLREFPGYFDVLKPTYR